MVINNNTLAQLLIRYAFNERQELEFEIAPEELLTALKVFAINERIDYGTSLTRDAVWLSRRINSISDDLIHAGLAVDIDVMRKHKRFIRFTKINKNGHIMSEGINMYSN